MSEDEIRDLLREMREEPVPTDSLVRVRARLEDRMRRRARRKIAAWVMACAAVFVGAILMEQETPVRRPGRAPAARHQEIPPAELPLESPRPIVRPAIAIRRKPRKRAAESVVIRMETPDPNVVIVLLGN